jgi:octaprenyl-diphosphate synthase
MTLPLIYALNNASRNDKKWMIKVVKRYNENNEKVRELMAKVKALGGIQYTQQKMHEYRDKALKILEDFPASESKTSLINLINYTIERVK